MENKKVPQRMCIACKESKPKKELIRIVKVEESFVLDKTGKLNGRGCYICNTEECKTRLFKQKALNKAFKTNISQETYDKLKENFVENR